MRIDPRYLYQGRCVEHLLDNAIKFTMYGDVTLSLNIMEGEADEDTLILITVSDTGPGMSPQQVQNAFSKYWQDISAIDLHQAEMMSAVSSGSKSASMDCGVSPSSSFRKGSFDFKKGTSQDLSSFSSKKEKSAPYDPTQGEKRTASGATSSYETNYDLLSQKDTYKEVSGLGVGLNVINNIVQCMGVSRYRAVYFSPKP